VLSFDTECRASHWISGDYVSKEVTAVACRFTDEPKEKVRVWALGEVDMTAMLGNFLYWYDQADVVTGHYCRGHDLPLLNAMLVEVGMAPLGDKLVQDTKLDFIKWSGLSQSQKNLAALFSVESEKLDMDQSMWRSANRLEPEGIELAKARVVGDVHQQIEMREEMLKRGLLRPPRMWTSVGPMRAVYRP
jgi:hypothetical protein